MQAKATAKTGPDHSHRSNEGAAKSGGNTFATGQDCQNSGRWQRFPDLSGFFVKLATTSVSMPKRFERR